MTRPHHEWGSVEIAEHVRRDDMPRYADLREGRMYLGDDLTPLPPVPWFIGWIAAGVAITALITAVSPAPAPLETGPGFEICEGSC